MKRSLPLAVSSAAIILLCTTQAEAQDENALLRDEVAIFKKKLVATLDALGKPPAGYSSERESFNLPTEAYKIGGSSRYSPVSASADRTYGTQKKSQESSEELQKEYQTKLLEAQAKGDYAAMAKISQEMSQKISKTQLEATESYKDPIEVSIQFNGNPGATIDPDLVLFERSGAIALKTIDNSSSGKERVTVYIDPVALRETKQLSRVTMRYPEKGVSRRTSVLNASIDMRGPIAEVETWAKNIDLNKVLALLDKGD
jgi:hypothetical protein